jgi:protein TonB
VKPPPIQPRPPAQVPVNIPAPPPLNIAPVEHPQPPPPAPPVIAPEKPPPPKPTVISQPDWLRRPTGDDMAQYYPERAQRMGVSGHASITCTVNTNGTVSDCSVSSESPADQEFGSAALKLSKLFKMRPQTRDGAPVGGAKVTIPIGFQVPKD